MKTYVYDGAEVSLTGREAVKRVNIPGKAPREMKIVEITPFDTTAFEWKKWVSLDQLYEVIQQKE